MEARIKDCCFYISSDRVTDRKKYAQACLELLSKDNELQKLDEASCRRSSPGDIDWNILFKAATDFFTKETTKLQSEEDAAPQFSASKKTSRENNKNLCSSLMKTVIKQSCRGGIMHLDMDGFLDHIFDVFNSPLLNQYFGYEYMVLLARDVLPQWGCWTALKLNDWLSLLVCTLKIWKENLITADSTSKVTMADLLCIIMEKGSDQSDFTFVNRLAGPKIEEFLISIVEESRQKRINAIEDAILRLALTYTKTVFSDFPSLLCRFGQATLKTVLALWNPHLFQRKVLIIDFLKLQLAAHTSNCELQKAENWYRCLFRIKDALEKAMLNFKASRQPTNFEEEFPPDFFALAADVTFYLSEMPSELNVDITQSLGIPQSFMSSTFQCSALSTQMIKRRKLVSNCEELLDMLIEESHASCFPWICLLTSLVHRHSADFTKTVQPIKAWKSLSNLITAHRRLPTFPQVLRLCRVVLLHSAAPKPEETTEFQSFWQLLLRIWWTENNKTEIGWVICAIFLRQLLPIKNAQEFILSLLDVPLKASTGSTCLGFYLVSYALPVLPLWEIQKRCGTVMDTIKVVSTDPGILLRLRLTEFVLSLPLEDPELVAWLIRNLSSVKSTPELPQIYVAKIYGSHQEGQRQALESSEEFFRVTSWEGGFDHSHSHSQSTTSSTSLSTDDEMIADSEEMAPEFVKLLVFHTTVFAQENLSENLPSLDTVSSVFKMCSLLRLVATPSIETDLRPYFEQSVEWILSCLLRWLRMDGFGANRNAVLTIELYSQAFPHLKQYVGEEKLEELWEVLRKLVFDQFEVRIVETSAQSSTTLMDSFERDYGASPNNSSRVLDLICVLAFRGNDSQRRKRLLATFHPLEFTASEKAIVPLVLQFLSWAIQVPAGSWDHSDVRTLLLLVAKVDCVFSNDQRVVTRLLGIMSRVWDHVGVSLGQAEKLQAIDLLKRFYAMQKEGMYGAKVEKALRSCMFSAVRHASWAIWRENSVDPGVALVPIFLEAFAGLSSPSPSVCFHTAKLVQDLMSDTREMESERKMCDWLANNFGILKRVIQQEPVFENWQNEAKVARRTVIAQLFLTLSKCPCLHYDVLHSLMCFSTNYQAESNINEEIQRTIVKTYATPYDRFIEPRAQGLLDRSLRENTADLEGTDKFLGCVNVAEFHRTYQSFLVPHYFLLKSEGTLKEIATNLRIPVHQLLKNNFSYVLSKLLLCVAGAKHSTLPLPEARSLLGSLKSDLSSDWEDLVRSHWSSTLANLLSYVSDESLAEDFFGNELHAFDSTRQRISADQWLTALQDLQSYANSELSELCSLQNSRRFLQKCWSRINEAQGLHEQQPTVISFTLAVEFVLQMAQTNKNGLQSFLYIFRLASFRAVQLLPKYPHAGLEVINYLCQAVSGSEHLLLPFVPHLLKSLFQAANAKNFQPHHHQSVRKLLEWFIVEHSTKLEATLRLVFPPQECSVAADLVRTLDSNLYRTNSRTLEQELLLFLDTSLCEDAMYPAVIQRLTRSIRENRNGLETLRKTDEESSLHTCISVLRYYCRHGTPNVIEAAAKCLGELGPIDLTNPCLRPFDARPKPWLLASQMPTENPLMFHLAETALVHLFTMEKSSSKEEYKLAEKTIEAILASEEGNQIANVAARMGYAGLPYLRAYESNYEPPSSKASKLNLVAFHAKVDSEQLWCPTFGSPTGKTWLGNILVTIFDCLSKEHTIGAHLMPVVLKNENLAIQLFPLVIHYLLTENFAEVRPILSKHLRIYFAQVVVNHSKGTECSDAEYVRVSNVSILVQLVTYLRSQQMPPNLQAIIRCSAGLARNFWLDLNLFHVAQAASFCNAHFSAVLLAEMSCDELNPCTKQDIPIEEDFDFYRHKPDPLPSLISSCYSKLGVMDQGSEKESIPSNLPTTSNLQDLREKLRHLQLNRTEELLANSYSAGIEDLQSQASSYMSQWNLTNFGKESQNSQGLIDSCRLRIVEGLTQGLPESISALYPSLAQLRQVTEAEIILSSSNESLLDCLHSWESQVDSQCGYEQIRLVLNNRYAILRRLAREDTSLEYRVLEGYNHQAKLAVLANHFMEADKILDISEALAKNRYASLFNLRLEKAKCCWSSGLETVGLQLLNALIEDISKAAQMSLLPSLLELRGKWEDETRLSNCEMILRNFMGAVNLAIREEQKTLIPEARLTLAMYCDNQLQDMKKYVNTDAYQQRLKARETIAQEVKNLGDYKITNTERGPLYLTKSSQVEQNEAEMFEERRKNLLEQAVESYLHVLAQIDVGDGHLQALFRLVALWMDNRLDDKVANLLKMCLPKIPSHQWIPVLPQLAARLVRQARPNMYHTAFPGILQTIFVEVARQHPFHALPLLLAIGNSALETNAAKDSIEQDRIQTATAMLNGLKGARVGKDARVSVLTAKMEKLFTVLIDVANMEPVKASPVKFARNHALLRLRDLEDVLIPTVEIPVKPDGNYNDVVGIASFGEQYQVMDGVNNPKRVFCTGTDGRERSILIKGKDDLRQDAVMQQLFGIVNRFLERDTTTRDCKLRIQTYKVVPLSKLSGVIEWCENTTTLDGLLGTKNGLHARYFPQEMKPDATCALMKKVMQTPMFDKKVRMFEELLASFSPAMHYFFLEKFPDPAHWFEKRLAYTRSVAVASMVGYILGLGDRHMSNILVNLQTAEVVHIDFGIAFEQGSLLPVPEIVPFRLTRDMVDGMGVMKTSGTFEKSCLLTMQVLRKERASILTLLEVLLYDPMYLWIVAPNEIAELQTKRKKAKHEKPSTDEEVNANASRVLQRVGRKLQGMEESTPFSVEGQIRALIRQACDPGFLCRMYSMWKPHL